MINLIPNEEKKRKVRNFYFRFFIVLLTVLGFSIIVASAAILPSYFFSSVKKNLIDIKLETQKNEALPSLSQKTLVAVSDLENKLKLIEDTRQTKYVISERIINEIISKKMRDVKITEIIYDSASIKGETVIISGIASSRERLLLFRQALENATVFSEVNLPISNFIQGSNIKFSLSLIFRPDSDSVRQNSQ